MASNSTPEYRILADQILSPDEDIIVKIAGAMYKGSITEPNRYATVGDLAGLTGGSALNYVQVEADQVTVTTSPQELVALTITTTGAPVQISITGEGSNAVASTWVKVALHRDGTLIGQTIQIESSAISENVPYALNFIDDVAAGTYVYSAKIVGKSSGNWQFGEVSGPIMNAVELTGFKGDDGASGAANLVVPTAIKDDADADFITFEKTGTGTARIATPQDDLSLRSARDITLFAGDDGPGNVYIGWGDAVYTPDSPNKVATMGDILSNVLPTNMNNSDDQTVLTFEQSYTGTARIIAPQDDLALKSANDILLYPGEDGPGNVYIGWGDANMTPDANNRVATIGDINDTIASSNGLSFQYGTSNARTGSGDVLKFSQSLNQSIITGTAPSFESPTAQRIVIAGQDGVAGDGYDGEGGDVYLWAGVGGGTNGNGGDIKIDGGNGLGSGDGGYVKMRGGYSSDASGGFIEIHSGDSNTGSSGDINITTGYSNANQGGNVAISAQSNGIIYLTSNTLQMNTGVTLIGGGGLDGALRVKDSSGNDIFKALGEVVLAGDGQYLNSVLPENQIATVSDVENGNPEVSFTVNGGSLGTAPTFDGAPLFSGTYVKIGSLVHFQIQVLFTNITSFGTGQYYVDLPFPAKYGYQMRNGCIHDTSNGNQWAITGHVLAGESRMSLFFSAGSGQDEIFDYNSPFVLQTVDKFHISGDYIMEPGV